jgi:hypothetical protein
VQDAASYLYFAFMTMLAMSSKHTNTKAISKSREDYGPSLEATGSIKLTYVRTLHHDHVLASP